MGLFNRTIKVLGPSCLLFFSAWTYAGEWGIKGGIISERVMNGISLSQDQPAFQLSSEWNSDLGIFAEANAFLSKKENGANTNDGHSILSGYFFPYSDSQALEMTVKRDEYLDGKSFLEYGIQWYVTKRWSLEFLHTPDFLELDYSKSYLGVNWQPTINDDFFGFVNLGRHEYGNNAASNQFMQLEAGLGTQLSRRWQLNLRYFYFEKDYFIPLKYAEFGKSNQYWTLEVSYAVL